MADKICKIKDTLLDKVEKEIEERGLDRIDAHNLGETIDMIKDLAVAEEKCWKAEYYRSIVGAMAGGNPSLYPQARQAWVDPAAMREVEDAIAKAMRSATPAEKDALRNGIVAKLGTM